MEKAWSRFALECVSAMWFLLVNVHTSEGRRTNELPVACRALQRFLYIALITCFMPFLLLLSMPLLCLCYSAEALFSLVTQDPHLHRRRYPPNHFLHHRYHPGGAAGRRDAEDYDDFDERGREEKQSLFGRSAFPHDHTTAAVFSHLHTHSYQSAASCKSPNDMMCCICLDEYMENEQLRKLHCGHKFHGRCLNGWLQISMTCPICIRRVTACSRPRCGDFSDELLLCFL